MNTLILASSSPRRKELLRQLSIPYVSIHPEIDETVCDDLAPPERVQKLAELKAAAGADIYRAMDSGTPQPSYLLAADTLVAFRVKSAWKVIGKPESEEDARKMLRFIQGKTQHVYTGLCLLDLEKNKFYKVLSSSSVRFRKMSQKEIEFYVSTGEWRGAAGAYRLQGFGSCFIDSIVGSPTGVMGLPLRELYGILELAGYRIVT